MELPFELIICQKLGNKSKKLEVYLIRLWRSIPMKVCMNFVIAPSAVILVMWLKQRLRKRFRWKHLLHLT